MENPLKHALRKALTFLESQKYRYALIGGIANQVWGQARFTYDLDIKVFVPDTDYETVQRAMMNAFPEQGRPDLPMNPLIVSVKIDEILVDFLLTTPGYEENIITQAVLTTIDDLSAWVCKAEDLIIQKAIAGRTKDWQDIEGIIIEQYEQLDQPYVEEWLTQFAEALEQPEIIEQYQRIWQRVRAANSGSCE